MKKPTFVCAAVLAVLAAGAPSQADAGVTTRVQIADSPHGRGGTIAVEGITVPAGTCGIRWQHPTSWFWWPDRSDVLPSSKLRELRRLRGAGIQRRVPRLRDRDRSLPVPLPAHRQRQGAVGHRVRAHGRSPLASRHRVPRHPPQRPARPRRPRTGPRVAVPLRAGSGVLRVQEPTIRRTPMAACRRRPPGARGRVVKSVVSTASTGTSSTPTTSTAPRPTSQRPATGSSRASTSRRPAPSSRASAGAS